MPGPAEFDSVLFVPGAVQEDCATAEPAFFRDLNLDMLVVQMCAGHSLQRLEPFFWSGLQSVETVRYRPEVLREIERHEVDTVVRRFVDGFGLVRQQQSLRSQVRYPWQPERCLLDAAAAYCSAVHHLHGEVVRLMLRSTALQGLQDYLRRYVESPDFVELSADVELTRRSLDSVTYLLHVRGNRIQIRRPRDEPGRDVAELFERFRDHGHADDPVSYRASAGFSHIDAAILHEVAETFPDEFAQLTVFAERHERFVNTTIARLAHEVEFILACLEFKGRMERLGLPMSYPTITEKPGLLAEGCYDAALAASGTLSARVLARRGRT